MGFMDLKPIIVSYEKPGKAHLKFVTLKTWEIEKHLARYMLHGLDPSPIVEFKFKSHISNPVNGNEFLNRFMGQTT